MSKLILASILLTLSLCGCSKKDEASSPSLQTPPLNSADSSSTPTSDADKTATPTSPRSEGRSDRDDPPAKAASVDQSTGGKPSTSKRASQTSKSAADTSDRKVAAASQSGSDPVNARKSADQMWRTFKAEKSRCSTLGATERARCLTEVGERYQSARFDCAALPEPDRTLCTQYTIQGDTAMESPPKAPVTHTKNPTTIPETPGDSRPAERNRDSTKQQQDAAGALTGSTKSN
jgi:hypothetical protein